MYNELTGIKYFYAELFPIAGQWFLILTLTLCTRCLYPKAAVVDIGIVTALHCAVFLNINTSADKSSAAQF